MHCGSAAVRDVCSHYGYDLSERMCFGLGGGLGFYYSSVRDTDPSRLVHLRGPMMEVNFFRNFGLGFTDWKYETDPAKASEDLVGFIREDVPVLIQTDIRHLDYYGSSTHFPGHVVVACGYDDSESVFYVADNSFEELQAVSRDGMEASRSSKAEPYPLSNNWLEVNLDGAKLDLEKSILRAVRGNALMMLGGFSTRRGISGVETLEKWARELPGWKYAPDWKWSARFSYQVICRRGVDGAGFRRFYGDFLEESSDALSPFRGLGLRERMEELADRWSEIGFLLRDISESSSGAAGFSRAAELAFGIHGLEKSFYSDVAANVCSADGGDERIWIVR